MPYVMKVLPSKGSHNHPTLHKIQHTARIFYNLRRIVLNTIKTLAE
jgi:hypothetical protein